MVFRDQSLRHVDVAILYGLGQKDRAQHVARRLRPTEPLLKAADLSTTVSDRSTGAYLSLEDGAL